MNAFINQVNAQAGKKISQADADALIAQTQAIIDAIQSGSAKPIARGRDADAPIPDTYSLD